MRPLLFSALLLLSGHTQASEWNDSQAVDKLFGAAGVKGTFVLYDVQRQRYVGHDRERAETRFVPASTYKVANSLIGLSTGAVRSADEVLPYGGKPQRFKAWEHDMSLRDAIIERTGLPGTGAAHRPGADARQCLAPGLRQRGNRPGCG